jgi:predicted nuclease of predicted toxin-antitoxin system
VRLAGLERADDLTLWHYAKTHGYVFVTLDSDFAELAALFGSPPKVIWLRRGNRPTAEVEALLRQHRQTIEAFGIEVAACLEIY